MHIGNYDDSSLPGASPLYIGVDLAWGSSEEAGNETGVVALRTGARPGQATVVDAGWTQGLRATTQWIGERVQPAPDALVMVDAPLVVANASGQRRCEHEVGVRYGRHKVSANSTNRSSPNQAGAELLAVLVRNGWSYVYQNQIEGDRRALRVSECYPYCTIVGARELGYQVRPTYKRRPTAAGARGASTEEWRAIRKAAFDELARRLAAVVDLSSHPVTGTLLDGAPMENRAYKHHEDLLDAVLAGWTGILFDEGRCQMLGVDDEARVQINGVGPPVPAVIVAPLPATI